MIMGTDRQQAGSPPLAQQTANERFKEGSSSWFWGSMTGAALLHFLAFSLLPALQGSDWSVTPNELEAVDLPPEVEIPPPPEQIARPATPVIAEADIDEDITIAPTTFEDNPIDKLPPPPSSSSDLADAPVLTPMDVKPVLKNPDEVARALKRTYPPFLRDAGVGGTVVVWFFIDDEGLVQNAEVFESSGHERLDDAAMDLALSGVYRFSPAQNRDQRVPVWVSIAILFESR